MSLCLPRVVFMRPYSPRGIGQAAAAPVFHCGIFGLISSPNTYVPQQIIRSLGNRSQRAASLAR